MTLDEITKYSQNILGKDLYQIYLYGSCARGDDNNDSDIDVMIIIDSEKLCQYEDELDKITGDISVKNEVLLSTQYVSKKEWLRKQKFLPYYQNILNEGKLIYQQ